MNEQGIDLFKLKRKIDSLQQITNDLTKQLNGWLKLNQTCACPKCGRINEWKDIEKNEEFITLTFECECGTLKEEIYQRVLDVVDNIKKEEN